MESNNEIMGALHKMGTEGKDRFMENEGTLHKKSNFCHTFKFPSLKGKNLKCLKISLK